MHTLADVSFGEWLKRRRKAAGLTQAQLASQLNCSTSALKKFEAEERHPSAEMVEQLAEIFLVPRTERSAFLRFARGNAGLVLADSQVPLPWRALTTPRSNIPATTTSLIGRDKELAELQGYLSSAEIRLVSLSGPPGIGKTRLGIELARTALAYFPDGAFFVALAPLDNPALLAVTVAHALGYVGVRNMGSIEQLKDGIGEKEILLVLDNCEHLIEEVALLASGLLTACARLKILATSREALRISGEWVYPVPAFEVPRETSAAKVETLLKLPALILFAERARAVRPGFTLDSENVSTVSALCAQLDGLPLAIELIAARMRLMSPEALLQQWNDRFILSKDGRRAAHTRQKTLHNAIAWSYQLLSREEKRLLERLAIFSGGFTLEAAETIFSQAVDKESVTDLITSLLDKSLLQYALDARGEPRFEMLVTIQLFALSRLQIAGEELEARNAHLHYFLNLARTADQEIRGAGQLEWLYRLNTMRDNLRAALEWAIETGQTEEALSLVRNLHWYWFVRGEFTGARRWLERALKMPDTSLYPHAHAAALAQLSLYCLQLGEKAAQKARPYLEQALEIARTNNDRPTVDTVRVILGLSLAEEGDFAASRALLQESKARFVELGDEWWYAYTVLGLAVQSEKQQDWATSLAQSQQALAGFQKLGDRYFQSVALRLVGRAYVHQGDPIYGVAALREAVLLAQALDNKFQIALILWRSFAEAAQHQAQHDRAVTLISAAIHMFQSIGAWMEDDDALFEKELAPLRKALRKNAFNIAMEKGRSLSMEQAIFYALEATR